MNEYIKYATEISNGAENKASKWNNIILWGKDQRKEGFTEILIDVIERAHQISLNLFQRNKIKMDILEIYETYEIERYKPARLGLPMRFGNYFKKALDEEYIAPANCMKFDTEFSEKK
ncbi:MAG: hypothetical protein ACRCZK_01895 [Oscillospiraceae bacterium]